MSRFRNSAEYPGEETMRLPKRPLIGLSLGGGAARGWSHIGILRVLIEAGLTPDVITGTSIGAVVGGCWAASRLDELEEFARSLTRRSVFSLMDFSLGGRGLISGDRLGRRLEDGMADFRIENLPVKYAAVATEISTGHEVWLTQGSLVRAMRASYAIPGIFEPVKVGERWLMDGVLVNPIPVTTARALGADFVVAVNLHSDVFSRSSVIHSFGGENLPVSPDEPVAPTGQGLLGPLFGAAKLFRRGGAGLHEDKRPGIASVMIDAFNITQDRIARSRLAGDPPDVMLGPKLGHVGLTEFHKAGEAIDIGAEAARRMLPEIRSCFEEVRVLR
jgi:NTE family protein